MRPNLDSTQSIPRPAWQNPRVHLLDDIWLLTIVAILVATGIPWFAGGFEADVGTASWGLLAIGGMRIPFALLASPSTSYRRWRDHALTLLHAIGVLLIGFIWQHVGALQNPLFLMVFALPVFGAIFLSRWQPYLIAVLSVFVVGIVALSEAPELRAYAGGLIGGDAWLTALFGSHGTARQPSFAGFYAPTSYLIVLLEVFTVTLFACAVAAEYVGTIFERLGEDSIKAQTEAERGQELAASLIERLPMPALMIDPDSLQIVAFSELAAVLLRGGDVPLEGRHLFEAVQFSYPDLVQELIVGPQSAAPLTAMRVAGELRLTQLRVLQVAHKGRRLALLIIEDATQLFCLKAALDTSEYAALVVDARGRVQAFNRLVVDLFGSVEVGTDAAQLLSHTVAGLPWWDPGLTRRRKMHVEIGSRIYQVSSTAIALPGEEECLFSVSLLPVAKGGTADPFATNSSNIAGTMRRQR